MSLHVAYVKLNSAGFLEWVCRRVVNGQNSMCGFRDGLRVKCWCHARGFQNLVGKSGTALEVFKICQLGIKASIYISIELLYADLWVEQSLP
jgi:hypothetical protein